MKTTPIAFIDHYDSFSFNVMDWLIRGGVRSSDLLRIPCDDAGAVAKLKSNPMPTVFGPGPNAPQDVPASVELAKALISNVPILGICLGHQILGYMDGAVILEAQDPWHGKPILIERVSSSALLNRVPDSFMAVCYNSLVVDAKTLPAHWLCSARNKFGEIMAMERQDCRKPAWSLQFHPESFLSEWGTVIAQNWLDHC